ncbi:MAG: hypothetical protein AAGD92_06930 [Pseudomonadota bacterium]
MKVEYKNLDSMDPDILMKNAITALQFSSNNRGLDDSIEQNYSQLIDLLVACARRVVHLRAQNAGQLLDKIVLWRALACEDALSYETASLDEALILSIVEDVHTLLKQNFAEG